ncbi:hypothetical protein SDC9_158588 [bioreactor metagenome]|uniref:Uncharacterized protein n=1 Tax=bioreactor metagenome TaxID=1076179 RepID=A0A645FAK3_9ZZZZ
MALGSRRVREQLRDHRLHDGILDGVGRSGTAGRDDVPDQDRKAVLVLVDSEWGEYEHHEQVPAQVRPELVQAARILGCTCRIPSQGYPRIHQRTGSRLVAPLFSMASGRLAAGRGLSARPLVSESTGNAWN